ncbi:MAG: hypothetical protein AAGB51_08480 [Planctomycetota bacterium]
MSIAIRFALCCLLLAVPSAYAQSATLGASATVFMDSNSMMGVRPPDLAATAGAGFLDTVNLTGTTSPLDINTNAMARSEYGFGRVSAFNSLRLNPVGLLRQSGGTTTNALAIFSDDLTFSWNPGFESSDQIPVRFVLEVLIPSADPTNPSIVLDAGTSFSVESSLRVTGSSSVITPSFNTININQNQSNFTPGSRTETLDVMVRDGGTVDLTSSLDLDLGGFVRANSDNPADDILSNEIGLTAFYQVYVELPEGASLSTLSQHNYVARVIPAPAGIGVLTAAGIFAVRRRRP